MITLNPAAAEPVEEKEVKEEVEQLAPPLAVDFEEETPKVEDPQVADVDASSNDEKSVEEKQQQEQQQEQEQVEDESVHQVQQ